MSEVRDRTHVRKPEAQAAYRARTGDFMGKTRRAALVELVRRHRQEFEEILREIRQSLA